MSIHIYKTPSLNGPPGPNLVFLFVLPSHVEMGETLRSSNETSGVSRGSSNPALLAVLGGWERKPCHPYGWLEDEFSFWDTLP